MQRLNYFLMKKLFDDVSKDCSKLVTRKYSTSFSLGISFLDSKIQDAISILAGKKIDLALLYRRWGGSVLGCRGNVLLDILLSPPLSLDLTRDEASILICEAGMKFYHQQV